MCSSYCYSCDYQCHIWIMILNALYLKSAWSWSKLLLHRRLWPAVTWLLLPAKVQQRKPHPSCKSHNLHLRPHDCTTYGSSTYKRHKHTHKLKYYKSTGSRNHCHTNSTAQSIASACSVLIHLSPGLVRVKAELYNFLTLIDPYLGFCGDSTSECRTI